MKKYLFLASLMMAFLNVTYAQIELPKIDFDKVEEEMGANKKLSKRTYLKDGATVLVVNYASGSMISGLCSSMASVHTDSIYIYHQPRKKEIHFPKKDSKSNFIRVKELSETPNQVDFYTYYYSGQLKSKSSKKLEPDYEDHENKCLETEFFVGEYFEYDETGKETVYRNYETGAFREAEPAVAPNRARIKTLKQKADKRVKENYGEAFFNQYIRSNYAYTTAFYGKRRNAPDMYPKYRTWWLKPNEQLPNLVDFAYNFVTPDGYQSLGIMIRMDSLGNIDETESRLKRSRIPTSYGLLKTKGGAIDITYEAAFEKAKQEGFPVDENIKLYDIFWKKDGENGSYGTVHYRFMGDKYEDRGRYSYVAEYKQWLINPFNSELSNNTVFKTGWAAIHDFYRHKKDGKWSFKSHNKLAFPYLYDELDTKYSNFMYAKKDGKVGYIDYDGNTVVPFIYDYIRQVGFRDTLSAKTGDFYTLINKKGEVLWTEKYKDFQKYGDDFYIVGNAAGKYGAINLNGEILVPLIYDKKLQKIEERQFQVEQSGKTGIVDTAGKIIIPIEYDQLKKDINGWFIVQKDGLSSIIDGENKTILKPKYESIERNKINQYLYVTSKEKYGILTPQFKKLVAPEYHRIVDGSRRYFITYGPEENHRSKKGIVDTLGKVVLTPTFDDIKLGNDKMIFAQARTATTPGKPLYAVYNEKGKEVTPPTYNYIKNYYGVIMAKKGTKAAPLGTDGQPLTEFIYDSVSGNEKSGKELLIFAYKDRKGGVLDYQGKPLTAFNYTSIRSLTERHEEQLTRNDIQLADVLAYAKIAGTRKGVLIMKDGTEKEFRLR